MYGLAGPTRTVVTCGPEVAGTVRGGNLRTRRREYRHRFSVRETPKPSFVLATPAVLEDLSQCLTLLYFRR